MSKIINNFQGRNGAIVYKAPILGINSDSIDNPNNARYIQNMYLNEDNNLSIRNGTKIVSQYAFDVNKIFKDQIKLMDYVNINGNSEILIYQTYLINLPYVNIQDNVTLNEIIGNPNETRIIIDTTPLNVDQKAYLSKAIFNGVYFYVRQDSFSDGADIDNVIITANSVSFTMPFPIGFFDIDSTDIFDPKNVFQLWIERAGIYKILDNNGINNPINLILDLAPNVSVSYINYQNRLIVCNGIDPVLIYDGNVLQELKSDYQIILQSIHKINDTNFNIKVNLLYEAELRTELAIGKEIKIFNNLKLEDSYIITNSVFNIGDDLEITITLNKNINGDPRGVLYKKSIPYFNYINVINDRLFALDEGGTFLKKFRNPDKSMLVYYCAKRKSIFNWYNNAGFIESINLAANSNKIDDLQCFTTYQGRILFWGKESVQIWTGNEPTVVNDGQNIDFGDFRWQKTEPIGIYNKNMFIEMPNVFIFLSKFGICSLKIDGFNNLNIDLFFAESVNGYIKKQLEDISTDREYRSLNCFLYPYGGFIGFRFPNNCYIFQLKGKGFWSVFTQDFSKANSFLYDSVSKNLYLTNENKVLIYCDKLTNKNYLDKDLNPIVFNIHYNWLNISNTWYNDNIYLGCYSYNNIEIDICLYVNYNSADCNMTKINVDQNNTKYDFSLFNIDKFSYNENGIYPQETLRFRADSVMIAIKGIAEAEFIFDSLYLSGGIDNGNG